MYMIPFSFSSCILHLFILSVKLLQTFQNITITYQNQNLGKELTKMNSIWSSISNKIGASLLAHSVKNLPAIQRTQVRSLVRKILWRRKWQRILELFPGKSLSVTLLLYQQNSNYKNRYPISTLGREVKVINVKGYINSVYTFLPVKQIMSMKSQLATFN